MATKTWISTSSGDWNTAGNWDGGVPAPGDVVIIRSGTAAITTNITGLGATTLALLYIEPGYTNNIGGSGNDLTISATKVTHLGSGQLWMEDGTGPTVHTVIDCASPSTVVNLGGASFSNVYVLRGTVTIDATCTATNLYVHYHDNPGSDANVTILAGAGTCTLYRQTGGVVVSENTLATCDLIGGRLTKQGSTTITTLNQNGGECIYNVATGTIGTCHGQGGRLDLTRSGGVKTITTLYRTQQFDLTRFADSNVHIIGTDINMETGIRG